jgi:hypothetical protein
MSKQRAVSYVFFVRAAFIIIILIGIGFSSKPSILAQEEPRFVNLVSLVRGKSHWIDEDSDWFERQADLIVFHRLKGTWLLDYDALTDGELLEKVKAIPEEHEIGLLMEITADLAKNLELTYDELASSHEPQNVFLSGYSIKERTLIIDELFKNYLQNFGSYPKSVGAWFIDSWSLQYMEKTYDVEAVLLVAEQYTTDHHTVRGHVWQAAYYPSLNHSLIPAPGNEKLDLVIIQWAARDPLRGYGYGPQFSNYSVQANDYTQQGLDSRYFRELVTTYLDNPYQQFNQLTVGIEVGQEGALYFEEFSELLDSLSQPSNYIFTSMSEFSKAFKKKFPQNPEIRFTAWEGEAENSTWAGWVTTNYYRIGLLANNQGLWVRDLRIYDDTQDDLHFIADRRRELVRQSQALVDEVGLGRRWLLIKTEEPITPQINQEKSKLTLTFGNHQLIFNSQGFQFNFESAEELKNLKSIQENGWHNYFPREKLLPSNIQNQGWQYLLIIFMSIFLLFKLTKTKLLLISSFITIIGLSLNMREIIMLTPMNDLGLSYISKIPHNLLAIAIFSYILAPLFISLLGIVVYILIIRKSGSLIFGILSLCLFYFGASLGWIFPLYRRLPLDPGLVTGLKANLNFIWFFKIISFEKLAYAFSAGQMNIAFLDSLVRQAFSQPILIIIPLVTFLILNFGILLIGVSYWLFKLFKRRSIAKLSVVLFLLVISPLLVNKLDVRFPTIADYVIFAMGATGLLYLTSEVKHESRLKFLILTVVIIVSFIPGFISLYRRNEIISMRSDRRWSDRKKIVSILKSEPRIVDVYLNNIRESDSSSLFMPIEIDEHLFVDTKHLKNQVNMEVENSYAIIGKKFLESNKD